MSRVCKQHRSPYLPNREGTKRCSGRLGVGGEVRGARSSDTAALLFTLHLGRRHRVPCKKIEYRQPEGASLLPPKMLLLGQERAEGRGQGLEFDP